MLLGKRSVIPIVPGVNPKEDSTALDTLYFTDANRIRFQNGKLRQIGGWQRFFSNNFQTITGSARTIYSYYTRTNTPVTIIGTNTRLYAKVYSTLYNITPLQNTSTLIPNSLTTEYNSSVAVDVTTVAGSSVVTLTINHYLNNGDNIQISGVAGGPYNGIPASNFNNTFICYANNQTSIRINTGANATASGTVTVNMTWATSYLFVNYVGHNLPKGDRIWIQGSTDVANILAADINIQNYITNVVDANNFTIQTNTIATSGISAAGGALTNITIQIAAGRADQSDGSGYGGGLYGEGRYGIAKAFGSFNTLNDKPRIWSMDTYGGTLYLTPGDPQTETEDNIYVWRGDVTVGPTLLSAEPDANAIPLAARWIYVSNNSIGVLGSSNPSDNTTELNSVSISNQGDPDFQRGPQTSAIRVRIQQAGALISQASSRNKDLLFSDSAVFLAQYVDPPFNWLITELFTTDGLIGPKARVEIQDAVFWMGQGDFYVFDGTSVSVLPNNTLKRYVYDNIDLSQSFKVFAYPNVAYQEISWYYCIKDGTNPLGKEPTHYVTYNYKEQHWTLGRMSRTAAEEPINIDLTPYTIQSNLTTDDYLFQMEVGLNDYNPAYNPLTDEVNIQYAPMNAYATTNFAQIGEGDTTMRLYSVFPDSIQQGELKLYAYGKLYPQGPVIDARGQPYTITPSTTKVDVILTAKQRQYKIETSGLNTNFLIGRWIEEGTESSPR